MTQPIDQLIDLYPLSWPDKGLEIQPGDFRLFAPAGTVDLGLAPGDAAHDSHSHRPAEPLRAAPLAEPAGGTVYVDGQPSPADLAAVMRLLRVDTAATDYAAFLIRAADPLEQRYVTQMRLVRVPALIAMYHALTLDEGRSFRDQRLTIGDLVPAFIAAEQEAWRTQSRERLASALDPSGPSVKPSLAFGVAIENVHYGIYRIWSRIWLLPQ